MISVTPTAPRATPARIAGHPQRTHERIGLAPDGGDLRHTTHAVLQAWGDELVPGAAAEGADACGLVAQLLDGFSLWIGARAVTDLPRGKTRALLKFLLLNRRRPTPRTRLVRLFWPDAEHAAARNSLNVALHRLRKALGDPALLVYTNDCYQLQPAGMAWIDVEQFVAHAEAGRSAQDLGRNQQAIRHFELAAALYRANLLDDGDDEPALQVEAQALHDRLNQVLDQLANLLELRDDPHACLQATLRHLQLDACNESAHQRLMRCYAKLGQPQLAERQYRCCISALRASLDLCPSEATTALYRRIAARQFPGRAGNDLRVPA
jgi:DNA-binding SARP family transcriptional activator